MPRTEVYQLRLTKAEKDELGEVSRSEGMSIAVYIRSAIARRIADSFSSATDWGDVADVAHKADVSAGVAANKQLTRLIKQLEAQGNPDAEEVARKRLGM